MSNELELKETTSPLLNMIFLIRERRNSEMDYKMGKVLTIIDAVIVNKEHNKSVKDVIKSAFYGRDNHWGGLEEMFRQLKQKYAPNIEDNYTHRIKDRDKNTPFKVYNL